ncbi:MAG: hypothetical protein JNK79_10135 [Chitinophagaceae bacterium]|nr:hypothetical protein [Chitinophagaceae bacterium]
MITSKTFAFVAISICISQFSIAQYKVSQHRALAPGEVAVNKPGNYSKPGTTYVLTTNISSAMTPIFLGKDVTLDLNGYTIRYADGKYNHVINSGFEEGTKGWNLSRAPGAKVVSTDTVHVFVGKKIMSLQAGDEITSSYVHLPVADRSYIAMVGVTGRNSVDLARVPGLKEMVVSVFVEDEKGNEVKVETEYSNGTKISCPVEKRSPRLGGGFIYAHLNSLPAGKYRVRVRADSDCLVDEIDIRPAFDAGVGIADKISRRGHFDDLYASLETPAFFDYAGNKDVPSAEGRGTVTIKNGNIDNATVGAISFGVQCNADNIRVILDNIKITTSGINTIAVDVQQASIVNCKFDVKSPFIINRHGSSYYAVDLQGSEASEVSFSEFYGGQGCLVFKGMKSSIHDNFFANRQMVTNHYSVMAMGDSSRIFRNRVEPEVGSGFEIYRHRGIDMFDNIIKINSSPPTCEYGHEEYSTAALRMADYNARPGDEAACSGNRFYNNKVWITVKNRPYPDDFIPMSWAVYYSASGGDNYVFGNEIVVNHLDPSSKARAAAFYVCGGLEGYGGRFFNNRITTNVPAAWLATPYGGTVNTKIYDNVIIKAPNALASFQPFRMGWSDHDTNIAKNVEFTSNEIQGAKFGLQSTDEQHTYSVNWRLKLSVADKNGKPVNNKQVKIFDRNNAMVKEETTDENGRIETELTEYSATGKEKQYASPYSIVVGDDKKEVKLDRNSAVTLVTSSN